MTAGSSFSNLFGAGPVAPANPSFESLMLTASVALAWPLETTGGTPYVASQINITAAAGGIEVMMPPGETGSTGVQCMISNTGMNPFTVTTTSGVQIAVIATTQSWLISLIDNSTPDGSWQALQMASTVSSAVASGLAGPGLQAAGSQLEVIWDTLILSGNSLLVAANQATAVVWDGAAGILTLDLISNLGVGWYCALTNRGTQAITLNCSGGQTINGVGSLMIQPSDGGLIVCGAGGFNTIGALVTPLAIAAGGTGASTAPAALVNLGGTSLGISIFTAPSSASIIALLGLNNFTFIEASVSTDQSLVTTSSNTAYICTAALNLTLPLTTVLSTKYIIIASAEGGIVTLTPQPSDAIDGAPVNTPLTIPEGGSTMLATDANGNWWTIFGPAIVGNNLVIGGTGAIGGNVTLGGTLSVAGTSTLTGAITTGATLTVSSGGLNITGNGALNGTWVVSGAVTCQTTFAVTGNSTLTGSLTVVTGGVSFNGAGTAFQVPNGESIFNIMQTTGAQLVGETGWAYNSSGGGAFSDNINIGITAGGSSMLAVNYIAVSDARLKFDIENITPQQAWDWVRLAIPVKYRKRVKYDSDDSIVEAGFIAQDQARAGYGDFVAQVPCPGMPALNDGVLKLNKDFMLGLPTNYQIAFLTAALKDEREQRMKLEARLNALESK